MLKAQTGTSIKSDVKLAGQEAAQAVKEVKAGKIDFKVKDINLEKFC